MKSKGVYFTLNDWNKLSTVKISRYSEHSLLSKTECFLVID